MVKEEPHYWRNWTKWEVFFNVKNMLFKIIYKIYLPNFPSKMKLNKHIAAVHEDKKPYKCTECHFSFAFKGSLNEYYVVIHERKKQYKGSLFPSHAYGV